MEKRAIGESGLAFILASQLVISRLLDMGPQSWARCPAMNLPSQRIAWGVFK